MKKKDVKKRNTPNNKKAGAKRPPRGVVNGIEYPSTNGGQATGDTHSPKQAKVKADKQPKPKRQKPERKGRRAVRRQKNRTRLITFALVLALLVICIFISLKVLFIVQKVEVVGSTHYSAEEVAGFCAIPMEENIFRVDIDTIGKTLPENFTYIESAKAQRKLPNKILITIVDAVPTYYVAQGSEEGTNTLYTIYSRMFKPLTTQSAMPDGLVCVDVNMDDEECTQTFHQLIKIIDDNGYANVTKIGVQSISEMYIEYDNRIIVNLGTMLDMEYKLKMAYHVLQDEISVEEHGTIDATASGQVVYKMG